jgi:hypothetical protein
MMLLAELNKMAIMQTNLPPKRHKPFLKKHWGLLLISCTVAVAFWGNQFEPNSSKQTTAGATKEPKPLSLLTPVLADKTTGSKIFEVQYRTPACYDKADFDTLAKLGDAGDREAAESFVVDKAIAGGCISLRPSMQVTIDEDQMFRNRLCVRPQGLAHCAWTYALRTREPPS